MINKYPYTDFNEYNMDWIIKTVKDLSVQWAETHQEWQDVKSEWTNYKNYIDTYFENLDLTQEVSDKLDQMAADGTIYNIFHVTVENIAASTTSDWIADNLLQEVGYVIDNSLTTANAAADAKAVGDRFDKVDDDLVDLTYGIRDFDLSNVPYIGYYTMSGGVITLNDGNTQGTTSGWGIYLLKVRKGKTITISGCKSIGGAYSVWLNSNDLNDIYKNGWYSAENNGTHVCESDWLAISDHDTAGYIGTLSVTYDYDSDINNLIAGEFDVDYNGSIASGSRFMHIPAFSTAGQHIRVKAEMISGTSTGLDIYYNNDNVGHLIARIKYGIEYEFILSDAMTQFDAYLAGLNADSVVNVYLTVLGDVTLLKEYVNGSPKYINIYKTSFNMTAGTAHSSLTDQIMAHIPFGTSFSVLIESSNGSLPAFMMNQYDESGSPTANNKVSTSGVKNSPMYIESCADIDVEKLGFFVTAPATNTTITAYVAVKEIDVKNYLLIGEQQIDPNLRYAYQKDFLAALFKKPAFLVYTDIHNVLYMFERIKEFYDNTQSDYVFDRLFLGDLIDDRFEDTTLIMNDNFYKDTLSVIGNHDVWHKDGTTATALETYNKYIAPNVARWNVVQPANAGTYGYCYYYKDYPDAYGNLAAAFRVIVLDEYHYDSTQHTWFVNTLNDAISNTLPVVVCTHQSQCTTSEITALDSNYPFACPTGGFNMNPIASGYAGSYANAYINRRKAIDDFKASGGTFICWMTGHMHRDDCGTFTETNGKQLNISFINASQDPTTKNYINNMSEDTFQYIAFDVSQGYVYIVRIGSPVDKWLHSNQYLVYDYVNDVVIDSK